MRIGGAVGSLVSGAVCPLCSNGSGLVANESRFGDAFVADDGGKLSIGKLADASICCHP